VLQMGDCSEGARRDHYINTPLHNPSSTLRGRAVIFLFNGLRSVREDRAREQSPRPSSAAPPMGDYCDGCAMYSQMSTPSHTPYIAKELGCN
jgi:hypothetical protein